jgi:T5SS/PEP-CTERM-associated repeat protein/autotransporter-associated beta strand protein
MGGYGTAIIAGSGSRWTTTGNLAVGVSGTGVMQIFGGRVLTDGIAYLGYNYGSSGSVTLSGSGSQWVTMNNLAVGYSGTASLVIANGGQVISEGADYIAFNPGSSGAVTVSGSGSSWTNAQGLAIGVTGALSVTGGANVSVTGTTTIASAGELEFDGVSTFTTGSLTVNGGALVTLGAATFAPSPVLGTYGVQIKTGGYNSTFSGNFTGTGGITKSDFGVASLTGASTYTGATAINSGTLALTTGPSRTASLGNTAITVASGATFAATLAASPFSKTVNAGTTGSGTAGATLTLNPGSTFSMVGPAIATFNLRQETTFSGPAFTIGGASGLAPTLIFDIGNAATGPDSIDVTKTVTVLATGAKITIDALAGDTTLTAGNYDLITSAGGFSGSAGNHFTLTDTTLLVDGTTYDFSLANSTTADEILTVSVGHAVPSYRDAPLATTPAGVVPAGTSAIPEPAATTLSLLSIFALAAARQSRRRK